VRVCKILIMGSNPIDASSMICPNCRKLNGNTHKHCTQCGTLLENLPRILSAERPLLENVPEIKRYGALIFIANLFEAIGKVLAGIGFVWLAIFVTTIFYIIFYDYQGYGVVQSFLTLLVGPALLFLGFINIATSESIRLMIDLQHNADLQSILLTHILRKSLEKGS